MELFWDVFRLWEPHLGMPVEWLLVSEGSGLPPLSSPLSHLNSLLWWPFWDPLDNLSQDGQECHIQNNFSFPSDTTQLHQQNWPYSWLADLLHQFHLGFLVFSLWRLSLFFPFWLYTWVPFSSIASHCGGVSHDGTIVLQLPRRKQCPQCLWPGNIWSSSCGGLWEQGISSFCPCLRLPGHKEKVRVTSGVFTINFVSHHVLIIWGSGPCRNYLVSSPPCAPVESFLATLTEVSVPAATGTLQTQPHSPLILAWGNKAPY